SVRSSVRSRQHARVQKRSPRLVAEAESEIATSLKHLGILRHETNARRLGQRDQSNRATVDGYQTGLGSLREKPRRGGAEAKREKAIGGDRIPAALEMAQHDGAGLLAGESLDLGSDERADAAEPPLLVEGVLFCREDGAPALRLRTLRHAY